MSHLDTVKAVYESIWKDSKEDIKKYFSDDFQVETKTLDYIEKSASPVVALSKIAEYWKGAFPDLKSEWTSVEENGDSITTFWKAWGTHTGNEFMGIPPKGTAVTYTGKTTYIFKDDKLIKCVGEVNYEGLKQQLLAS